MANEVWLPVVGFEGWYEVSDRGVVRSVDRTVIYVNGNSVFHKGQIMSMVTKRSGHFAVGLRRNSGGFRRYVHRLVLEAFVGPCPEGLIACHNNGDPTDNRLENLRWDTPSSNMFDKQAHGTDHQRNKTHCPRGHALEVPNLVPSKLDIGIRDCLACNLGRKRTVNYMGDLQAASDAAYARIMHPHNTKGKKK